MKVADSAGKESVAAKAPTKIVTSNASSLEMLLRLGAGDRVIGTGFPPGKGTLPADLAEQGAKVPVLGEMVIPKEKQLGSGADLYVDTVGGSDGAARVTDDRFQHLSSVGCSPSSVGCHRSGAIGRVWPTAR